MIECELRNQEANQKSNQKINYKRENYKQVKIINEIDYKFQEIKNKSINSHKGE